ncbi:MAG TPA: PEGA domain-containing protein [Polyangiaceae bacterium]|nr:PEGA domain-containing protein [Polyangiaceae bacterium]
MKPVKIALRASAACLVTCLASAAAAHPPARAPKTASQALSDSLQGPAKAAYDSARMLVANGDFVAALAKFKEAYDTSKEPQMLYDMAICEKNLRHYARMQVLLQRYLQEGATRLTASDRASVDGALAAIKELVASLSVTVSEAGASVVLDGEDVGVAPLDAPIPVDLGTHQIRVTKADFKPIEQSVEATGGQALTVTIALVRDVHLGELVLKSDDEATLSIDDTVVGKGHFDSHLAPGTHRVRLTAPGKEPYQADIGLRDGEVRTLDITLRSQHHAAVWPWVVGSAVVVAGAAVGGYFLLKPKDTTEPFPTGTAGAVQFSAFGR